MRSVTEIHFKTKEMVPPDSFDIEWSDDQSKKERQRFLQRT